MKFEEWLSQQNGVIEVDCGCVTTETFYHWMRVAYEAGNSPVIPDGSASMLRRWLAFGRGMQNAGCQLPHNLIAESEAMLAADPHDTPALNSVQSVVTVPGKLIPVSEQKPDCWCLTCRPVVLKDMRFVVCPDCGNKRCPRANDHRNACTGSNEPGQEGSAYPAAPQSPGSEPATVPGKWIPVSERMPEVGVKVLCFPAEDEPIHAVFNGQLWLQDISWSNSDEPIDNVITCNVTHWVPLPASPQEVK